LVKNNKTLIRSVIIFSFLTFVFMQSCYLFCLFRPESALEDTVEQFVEDDLGIDVFDEPPQQNAAPEIEKDLSI
jgi:hypothetical protein